MITKENYEYLKEHYGNVASWAVWTFPNPEKAKSNIDDLSVFNQENILNLLNSNYVFVGLNASEQETTTDSWRPFHSDDMKRQQDYKLRYALMNTRFWGSYITDFIKNYPKTDLSKEMSYLLKNPDVLTPYVQTFFDELAHISNKPTLIAMGDKTYKLLKTRKELNGYQIVKITHYAYTINIDKYKDRVLTALEKV